MGGLTTSWAKNEHPQLLLLFAKGDNDIDLKKLSKEIQAYSQDKKALKRE